MCMAPVFKPVKKAYRDNVIFNNDFVKICDPSMPKLTDVIRKKNLTPSTADMVSE